jgi:hypothetical protein
MATTEFQPPAGNPPPTDLPGIGESAAKPAPHGKLETTSVERMDQEFMILVMGMIFILTLSLALLMGPVVFWEHSPQVLEDAWRKGFFGFLVVVHPSKLDSQGLVF